jgi:hypothetical protein
MEKDRHRTPWFARISWQDAKRRVGWKRICILHERRGVLTLSRQPRIGDCFEVGHDYVSCGGVRYGDRVYFAVTSITREGDLLTCTGTCGTPVATLRFAAALIE